MAKLRVMTILGTRPEIIRLSRVVAKLDEHMDHHLVHTGQNFDYELSGILFKDLGLREPDRQLNAAAGGPIETIGNILRASDEAMDQFKPEALLVLGDTNSCLAAYAAKRRKIPVFHMEAGNRCRDQRVPEEINRRIIDHLADVNMPYSELARQNLLMEGLPSDRVIKTGSPMKEVIGHHADALSRSDVLQRHQLTPRNYFVASLHREENVDDPATLQRAVAVLNDLANDGKKRIVFSCHPRTRKRLDEAKSSLNPLVEVVKPLGFTDYLCLEKHAAVVLSDSGTITEEASILGFPAINLRESHERPEGMDEAAVIMTGLNPERIRQAIDVLTSQRRLMPTWPRLPADYDADLVSEKVVRLILSYTNYVRRTVWSLT